MSHPVLRVQLLGGFSLVYNEGPVNGVHSARLQSLLAYLLLHINPPQTRQHLAFLLWPDTTEAQARNNLRQLLFQLRQALPDADRFLMVDTSTVCWNIDETQIIDVHHFEFSLREANATEQRSDTPDCRHKLEQAVAVYLGDLLPGCYDDWITPERERLRQQYRDACQKLVNLLETQREYAEAIHAAQRLHRLDPLDEGVYVSLLRLHGLKGDRAGARRIYQTAVETLRQELEAEPGEAIQAAYKSSQTAPRTVSLSSNDTAASAYKLVGRQNEWHQLQAVWQRVVEGGATLSLITGEAGIGKSRLAEELFQWVTRQGFTAVYTRSYGMEGRLSLAPITEWLRSAALRPHLASLEPVWLTELARLLPELLSEHAELAQPAPITEYGRRQRFFEALARGVLAAPLPLLLWMDDLQWCDQETLEWLHFLLRFAPRNPVLVLGTVRSEEVPPGHPLTALIRQLQADAKVTLLELAPFDAAETARLASQVQGHAISDALSVRLYHETEGNPLFVVEAVRAGLNPALASPSEVLTALSAPDAPALPPRVQAVIAGRLAQLSANARAVVEIGAAIGCAFTLDLLLLAGQENEDSLIQALDELWVKRIVREQSANVFDFTHDKLREVTYAETSLPQRRALHRRIAQALEELHADALDPVSAQIAAHYEQAGQFEQAVPCYQRAGLVAASVYANEDAIHLFTRGLELLGKWPSSVKRDTQELHIQLGLATLYRISKGWASPEEERVVNRVMVLSDKVGNVEQRIRALFNVQALCLVQAQYAKVEQAHAQAEKLFRQIGETPPPFAEIYLAGAAMFSGKLAEARGRFDKIVAVRDDERVRDMQESHGLNYQVHGLAWNAHVLWCLGYPQSALQSAETAIEYARECAQPFSQALAISYSAMLQTWQTNTKTLLVQAEDACDLAIQYKAPYYHAWTNILLHFARTEQQPDAENLTLLRNAIDVFIETGARVRLPVYFSLLAQACLKAGQWEDGLNALELALTESFQNNEHWWDAEIHRLRGELMRAQNADLGDIEAAFQRALEISRTQQAKSLELRAATSLARLWQAHSRTAEAKQCLTPVYDWFTEGFDTPDLQTAQALLASL